MKEVLVSISVDFVWIVGLIITMLGLTTLAISITIQLFHRIAKQVGAWQKILEYCWHRDEFRDWLKERKEP